MVILHDDDRRKHSRVGFTTEIEIILKANDKEVILKASSKDLSMKGIFVRTDQRFEMGTDCSVNIYLTGGIEEIKLQIKGTIVRETETGIGVVFESMAVDTYTHLKNIVQYNSADESV